MLGDLCFRITDKAKERGHHMELICKKCLLREMAEADAAMIKKYVDAIKGEDRVPEKEYEARLAVCKACDRLNAGTCNACGCYVELRALTGVSHCLIKVVVQKNNNKMTAVLISAVILLLFSVFSVSRGS